MTSSGKYSKTSFEIRKAFIDYFARQGHEPVASSRLIPDGDDTLLFTNAGMNQFKNVFMGLEKRAYKRAVTSQKCVRAGGKHNDLENVGHTGRHHTFFEMLGNFSFGDYFKKDAIHFAWEFITKELGIAKDRLHVTVFERDDEAAEIWNKQEGLPLERISRFGEKDNFWRMGDVGPCGPCSEIFFDHGPGVGCGKPDCKVGCSCDRFVEIWNLVFMQFFEDGSGSQKPLPNPSIDTGAGLERLTGVLQGTHINYDTDLFQYLIEEACRISGKRYNKDDKTNAALRVLADHARASAFLITDGVLPSNEGRGYVLRRIMRRGIRYGRQLSTTHSLLTPLVEKVIEYMKPAYPELSTQRTLVLQTTQREEERFLITLDQGTEILNQALSKLKTNSRGQKLDGELAFRLYDTYGFPFDLTRIMVNEHGLEVDEADFEERMEKARLVSRASWKGKAISSSEAHLIELSQKVNPTRFLGYDSLVSSAKILKLSDGNQQVEEIKKGQKGLIILDQTTFYAESGGQVGDKGLLKAGPAMAQVFDCVKRNDVYLHQVEVVQGSFTQGQTLEVSVSDSERRDTARNHSATHLLHAALRRILGSHVTQAGSLVDAERLRFDFTHPESVTAAQLEQIENLVNEQIGFNLAVQCRVMSYKEAVQTGAMALFGEKYGDEVRVLKMGEFSTELCGGTHVSNTSDIRVLKVVSESSVSSGVRRIEALSGSLALKYLMLNTQENLMVRGSMGLSEPWSKYVGEESDHGAMLHWLDQRRQEIKNLEKEIRTLKGSQINADQLLAQAKILSNGSKFVAASVELEDREVLSQLVDRLRDKVQSGVVIVAGRGGTTSPLFVAVTKDLIPKWNAGQILKDMSTLMGGKGGGRPEFAQGAVTDLNKWKEAISRIEGNLK